MKRFKIDPNVINKLYQSGQSSIEIAKQFNCSWITIVRCLKRNNFNVRSHSEKTINAYKVGKMDFMPEVWKNTSKRWRGVGNPRFKSIGSKRFSHGYVYIKTQSGNWVQEHRFKIEQKIKRPLRPDEVVHHKNQNKSDNRLSNLVLMSDSDHRRLHLKDNLRKLSKGSQL